MIRPVTPNDTGGEECGCLIAANVGPEERAIGGGEGLYEVVGRSTGGCVAIIGGVAEKRSQSSARSVAQGDHGYACHSWGDIKMEAYANRSGQSNVRFYECGADFIRVQFEDGARYIYNYASAGSGNIEQMKVLAGNGLGLNAYIIKNVKKQYYCKER